MIVSDLDGTLLRPNKTISDQTKSKLIQCRKAGLKVIYATARGPSAEKLAPAELFDGKVTMNGAIAVANDTVIYNRIIMNEVVQPFLKACNQRGLKMVSELGGIHYANYIVSKSWHLNVDTFKVVDFDEHDKDAEKIYMAVRKPEDLAFVKKHLPDSLYITITRDNFAMIMPKEATKSKAINTLAQIWSIKSSEIVAFGDDLNDVDMLTYSGVGVAMENAVDEVKAVADHICKSNIEDGVALWLHENVLGAAD